MSRCIKEDLRRLRTAKARVRVPGPGPQTARTGRLAQNPVGPSSSLHLASSQLGALGEPIPFADLEKPSTLPCWLTKVRALPTGCEGGLLPWFGVLRWGLGPVPRESQAEDSGLSCSGSRG